MEYTKLTSVQIDVLKEVFNIGSGNSVTALSTLLNKKVDMSVPRINIIEFNSLFNEEVEKEVIAVLVRVIGESSGNILYIFKQEVATRISSVLIGENGDIFSELGMSLMGEIGNIVSASYMNAIATFTGLSLMPSVPAVTYDNINAILASAFIESGQVDEHILQVETLFNCDDGEDIMGNFYYIPEPGALENILKKLGMN